MSYNSLEKKSEHIPFSRVNDVSYSIFVIYFQLYIYVYISVMCIFMCMSVCVYVSVTTYVCVCVCIYQYHPIHTELLYKM